MPFSPQTLATTLAGLPQPAGYLLAYSGGGDSTALLHAAKALNVPLRAVHVNHHLHPDADRWAAHCEQVCRECEVPLKVVDVQVGEGAGQGLEAAARKARYGALRQCLQPGEMLLTAHHLDDQAETVLLQLLRGAGVKGLAGMRPWQPFGAAWHGRPLLSVPQADLRAYLTEWGIAWLQDPANKDQNRNRNFLRHQVLPLLETRWPAAKTMLTRAAGNLREVAEVVDAIAGRDLAQAQTGQGALSLEALQGLAPGRQRLVLRQWLARAGLPLPERAQLDELLAQIARPRPDAEVCVAWPGAQARLYRGRLYAIQPQADPGPGFECAWDGREPLALPAGLGRLALEPLETARVMPVLNLQIRFRRGGERIRLAGNDHHTELKTLFQEMAIPPWGRNRVPLLLQGEELVAVADWRFTAGFTEELGARGVKLVWE